MATNTEFKFTETSPVVPSTKPSAAALALNAAACVAAIAACVVAPLPTMAFAALGACAAYIGGK